MSLVSRAISALFNGISQQPATLRLPSQGAEQINAYGTVVDGLRKRPAFEHVARVSEDSFEGAFLHTINRDVAERYVVVITDGDIQVFDLEGNEKAVNPATDALDYLELDTELASESFAVVSIADYSFVVNKTKVITTTAAPAAEVSDLLYYIPGPWYNGTAPINFTRLYNVAQGTSKGSVQTFNDLPTAGGSTPPVEGDTWKIAGYDQDSFGAYYVVRRGGVWEETFEPGSSTSLNRNTMPHALVREADGTFSFKPFGWDVRKVGDEKSNPQPSFVGKTLQDVFYFKNRLGLVSEENTVFSGAGDFGNYWRKTVTALLDDDVVDVAISSTQVSLLKFAVPMNSTLMLFADQTQFKLNVDQLLTPKSVSIDPVTKYEMSTLARPLGLGQDIYFATQAGDFSRIREYFVDDGADSSSTDAADVTAHVPSYLPPGIIKLAGSTNEDVLFALSENARDTLYCYKFFWTGDTKAQSSWSHWELPSTDSILSIEMIDNELIAIIARADGTYIEKANVQSGAVTGDLGHEVLLDRLADITGVYNGGGDYTAFTLPYPVVAGNQPGFKMVRGSDFDAPLSLIDPSTYEWQSTTVIRVPGDHTDGEVWVGQNYEKSYTFSEQFMQGQNGPITTGRLMLRTFVVYFTDTAYFATSVAPYGNDPLVEEIVPVGLSEFSGKTLGAASLILNTPSFHTGAYAFQIYGDSKVARISLVNDSHVQSKFQSAEFEAFYHNRARSL